MPYTVTGQEKPEELVAAIEQLNASEAALKQESIKHRLEAKNFRDKATAYEKVLTHPETGEVLAPEQVAEIVDWSGESEGDGHGGNGGGDDDRIQKMRAQFDADAKRREEAYNKRIADLETKAKESEDKAAKQARDAYINEKISQAGLTGAQAAAARKLIDSDVVLNEDGQYGFVRKDKLGEAFVPLTAESLAEVPEVKLVMPKAGASGTGSGAPRPAVPGAGVDWERFKSDTDYRNDPKIKAMATEENKRLIGQG